ncbi:bifunctional antitoxin/transcriptional repressor RelB [Salmonella enterica subsp. enterica]|uniref:Bifunctional antitoxin/transcriptional repressor RelB n=1 Tax=Salmonella enterica I TaxID=59201 RepID=A0A447PPF3_SALET|nr:bifunctional antitoxin/transcriptional repressor RelB [Salmonella enterica subsp. enterica]
MATLNVRLDEKLKNEAYAVLEKLNITPTEAGAITVPVRRGNGAHASENRHS